MNFAAQHRDAALNYAQFNQDHSCVCAATRAGVNVFECAPFKQCFVAAEAAAAAADAPVRGPLALAAMLFNTSLVAFVGTGESSALSPRRLLLWNTHTMQEICSLSFLTTILAVRMTRKRLLVLLETKLFVYDLATMRLLHTMDTVPNPRGLLAVTSDDSSLTAVPGSPSAGEVLIFDTLHLTQVARIVAHKSRVGAIALNYEGTLLATASHKGTVIRVFHLPSGQKLATLRRGSYSAEIYSLSFNLTSSMLCVSSATGTVHIFKLTLQAPGSRPARDSSEPSSLRTTLTSYLPNVVNDIIDSERRFASIKLQPGVPSLCAISSSNRQVFVVTSDGILFTYDLDPDRGGECALTAENRLLLSGGGPSSGAAASSSGGGGGHLV